MQIEKRFLSGKRLSDYSSFGIGGPIRFYFEAKEIADFVEALQWAVAHRVPYFILGKGSNCLFDDRGWNGLVIRNRIEFCEIENNRVYAGAGYSFALLGSQSARRGLSGLEFAAGIPATVGGAVYMNAGASGQETFDVLEEVTYLDERGEVMSYSQEQLKRGYRFSAFQEMRGAILAARFLLKERGEQAQEAYRLLIKKRVETQPLKEKSAGCIFRNPSDCPAGALIDRCGLKGSQVGGAKVSAIHANFIVNDASATAKDVRELISQVQQRVFEETGVILEPEIRWVPFETI